MTDEQLLGTDDVARKTGTSESFWNKLRVAGDGPRYVKLGKSVRYRWRDVETWLAARTRQSTSDLGSKAA